MHKGQVDSLTTVWRDGRLERCTDSFVMTPETKPRELQVLNLHPEVRFQEFQGFGAAFTEASGSVLNNLPPEQAEKLVADCYGEQGLGYTWARVPVDSCDFSLGMYSACRPGADGADRPTVDADSFREHEQTHIIPWLHQAQALVRRRGFEQLRLCLVPWSPPAWMKSNGSRTGGGSLLPEFRQAWARYLCRYLQAYESNGLPVAMLGTQNEPNAVQTWDSCCYTARQEREFLEGFLQPELRRHGLGHVGLSAWDHNREGLFERIDEICTSAAQGLIAAAAFHWYSGDHFAALELVAKTYPELLLIFSEGCIEYSRSNPESQLAHAQRYGHNIIGDLNHGAHVWLDWNLTLDAGGGPNHVGNYCAAPIMCRADGLGWERRLSWYYLEHFSRHICPGSRRIGHSLYTDQLEATAWQRPDSSLVAVVMNPGEQELPLVLRCAGRAMETTVPGSGIVSFRYWPV